MNQASLLHALVALVALVAVVAAIAFVDTSLVYCMERGGALAKKDAEKILGRLSQVTGQNYSMETVGGYWIWEKE